MAATACPKDVPETADPTMPGFRDATVGRVGIESDDAVKHDGGVTHTFDQMSTFNRLVTGGVTLAVGVLVYNEVISALPSSGGAINQSGITSTVESAFQLAPVALIVIVAAVILAQVMGFRS